MTLLTSRIFATGLLLVAIHGFPPSARGQTPEPVARKFDEFTVGAGSPALRWLRNHDEQSKELKARLARYAAQLRREGARPYAITYSPRVVEWEIYNRSVAGMRAAELWQITGSGFDWKHINWVNGGFREVATTELWIVPHGAQPPCPTPTVRSEDVVYCPSVYVGGPAYVPRPGGPVEFKAVVKANEKKIQPTFAWSVLRGEIVGGQGTDTIVVEVPAGVLGDVVAKVEVGGYSLECPIESTAAIGRTTVGLSHFKFDEFGHIHTGDTKARLDNLAFTLQNDPSLQVHIVVYGGRVGPREQARRRADWMKDYLVMGRGMEPERIITIDGGYREESSGELWLSVRGTGAPTPAPTIDKSYVRLKGR